MDRIVHDVTTLTCTLHNAPIIACDNQLSVIQALHQAIQRWSKPTLPVEKKPHVTTHPPTRTRQRSILRQMRRPKKYQPQDLLPRVVIQKPNASPSPPNVPLTKNNYEPVSLRTRSRFLHTVDQPPPRVIKSPDTGPISRRTRSKTSAMSNIITPAQAAKQQYPAQFLQSMAMPVLNETSGQSLQYCQLRNHLKFAHI